MFWNLWWFRYSLEQGMNPFIAELIYYPATPNLIAHTFHPFGGIISIPIAYCASNIVTFNIVVLFGFVASGYGAYLLCREFGILPASSLVGGYIFTFSNYHFAHAEGHLNLVLMQWIPFYFLFLYRLMRRNSARDAALTAVSLFLVLLCDHYYFLFCVLMSIPVFVWAYWCNRSGPLFRENARPLFIFILIIAITSVPFVLAFAWVARFNEVISGNPAYEYGMDILALVIPGGHWRFARLTQFYWENLSGNIQESSVHVGSASIILAIFGYYALSKRNDSLRSLLLWLGLVSYLLSLGNNPQVWGARFHLPMPYDLLEVLLPVVKSGGVPVRFIVIAILAISVLAACGAEYISLSGGKDRLFLAIIFLLGIVELLPRPLPSSSIIFPDYIKALAQIAGSEPGAVLDFADNPNEAVVYQTLHKQPIQTGYLARDQKSVVETSNQIQTLYHEHQFTVLRQHYGFRYILSPATIPQCSILFDGPVKLYEIN